MLVNLMTNSRPVMLHGPKMASPLWPELSRHFLEHPPRQAAPDVTMLTWSNKADPVLAQSARLCGIPIHVCGADRQPWSNYSKFEYDIEIADTARTKYMMGCDGHDVVITGELQRAIDELEASGADMLFNGEVKFFPDYREVRILQDIREFEAGCGGTYPFLNSGIWIGRREFVRHFFDIARDVKTHELFDCTGYAAPLHPDSEGCDQTLVHYWHQVIHPATQVDCEARVFQNIAHLDRTHVRLMPELL